MKRHQAQLKRLAAMMAGHKEIELALLDRKLCEIHTLLTQAMAMSNPGTAARNVDKAEQLIDDLRNCIYTIREF